MKDNDFVHFQVFGIPKPAGSKTGYVIKRKDGSRGVAITDASTKAKPWQAVVTQEAGAAMTLAGHLDLFDGPLSVQMVFKMPRPKNHFRTGRNRDLLRDLAPPFPHTRPDLLKLTRAVEDACTGVIWTDDARIVDEYMTKVYAYRPGVDVLITDWTGEKG